MDACGPDLHIHPFICQPLTIGCPLGGVVTPDKAAPVAPSESRELDILSSGHGRGVVCASPKGGSGCSTLVSTTIHPCVTQIHLLLMINSPYLGTSLVEFWLA